MREALEHVADGGRSVNESIGNEPLDHAIIDAKDVFARVCFAM